VELKSDASLVRERKSLGVFSDQFDVSGVGGECSQSGGECHHPCADAA